MQECLFTILLLPNREYINNFRIYRIRYAKLHIFPLNVTYDFIQLKSFRKYHFKDVKSRLLNLT